MLGAYIEVSIVDFSGTERRRVQVIEGKSLR